MLLAWTCLEDRGKRCGDDLAIVEEEKRERDSESEGE